MDPEKIWMNPITKKGFMSVYHEPSDAIILSGEKGCGKYLAGRYLAARILACKEEQLEFNPDFCLVRSEHGTIKLEQIKDALDLTTYVAAGKGKRVLLFDDAEKITESGQNALLKTLEEGKAVMIFICHQQMLRTVESRCQKVTFLALRSEDIDSFDQIDSLLFHLSGGNMGIYQKLEKETDFRSHVSEILRVFKHNRNKREIMEILHSIKEKDTKNFFDKYGVEYCVLLLELLLIRMFQPFIIRHFDKSEPEGLELSNYTLIQAMDAAEAIEEHLVLMKQKKGLYNKNDFFQLLMELVE